MILTGCFNLKSNCFCGHTMFHDAESRTSISCLLGKSLPLGCTLSLTVLLTRISFDGHFKMFSTLVPKLEFSSDSVESELCLLSLPHLQVQGQ